MLAHFTEVRNTFPVISGQQAGDNTTELINQRKTDEKKRLPQKPFFSVQTVMQKPLFFDFDDNGFADSDRAGHFGHLFDFIHIGDNHRG